MDTAIAVARNAASRWRKEATQRLRISQHDPVSETLQYCAAEIEEEMRALDAPGAMRTVEQYAKDHAVTPQTVRNWIRRGQLKADRTPHGYMIQHTAQRQRVKRAAA
jgi:predicted transcriptional regulator